MNKFYIKKVEKFNNSKYEDIIKQSFLDTPCKDMIIDLSGFDPKLAAIYSNDFPSLIINYKLHNVVAFGSDINDFFPISHKAYFKKLDNHEYTATIKLPNNNVAILLNHHYHNKISNLIYLIKKLQEYGYLIGNNSHAIYTLLFEIGNLLSETYNLESDPIINDILNKMKNETNNGLYCYTNENKISNMFVATDYRFTVPQTSNLRKVKQIIDKYVNERE